MQIPKVEWPQRSCRDAVWGEHLPYPCELPEEHEGPCASNSVRTSLQRREAWERSRGGLQEPVQDEQKDHDA